MRRTDSSRSTCNNNNNKNKFCITDNRSTDQRIISMNFVVVDVVHVVSQYVH
jgi:hypothetical protein